MNRKSTTQLVTHGAALVAFAAIAAPETRGLINHSFLQGIWPIAKEILAVVLPIVLAYVSRGPGQVSSPPSGQ
jgi:hypothetical protein